MAIGLSVANIEGLVQEQLLSPGRYTVSEPGGKPIFTSEQRRYIAQAMAQVVAQNNEEIMRQLRAAGVSGI